MQWLPKAVLLDDDSNVQKIWAQSAKNARVELTCFGDKASLLKGVANMERRIDVFLESKGGNGALEAELAKELFNLGFRNIFVETATAAESFLKSHYIKRVMDKDPPWGA